MGLPGAILFLTGIALAVIAGLSWNVPEFEDFRGPVYLGWKEPVAFTSLGHGLHKLMINWHMTPFHFEV